jgi:hypothetical protein
MARRRPRKFRARSEGLTRAPLSPPLHQALLRWLEAFVRHPLGADDVTPVPGLLPPVQKTALTALGQVCGGGPVTPAAAWPDVLRTLAGLLCPFRAATQRQAEAEAAAAAALAAGAAGGDGGGGVPGSPHAPLAKLGSFGPGRVTVLSPRASIGRAGR